MCLDEEGTAVILDGSSVNDTYKQCWKPTDSRLEGNKPITKCNT